jgi:hypothetical protein
MPPRLGTRLEADQILMSELGEQILNGTRDVRRRAGDAHASAGPPRQILERRSPRRATVARDFECGAWMIDRVDDRQQIDRHVD